MNDKSSLINGWTGFTKRDWKEMYDTNTEQWPVWAECFHGGRKEHTEKSALETLQANGIHPDHVPDVFKEYYVIRNILNRVEKVIPLIYEQTPD